MPSLFFGIKLKNFVEHEKYYKNNDKLPKDNLPLPIGECG